MDCTDAIEVAEESAFNWPDNDKLQKRVLEHALASLLRFLDNSPTNVGTLRPIYSYIIDSFYFYQESRLQQIYKILVAQHL